MIKEVSWIEFKDKWITPFERNKIEDSPLDVNKPKDESRSGEEQSYLCKLILKGKTQEQCYKAMSIFSKWSSSTPQYKEISYSKALDFCYKIIEKRNLEKEVNPEEVKKIEEEVWKSAFYNDTDLKNYKPSEEEFLVDKFILKNHVGVLVGYSGERKTFAAIHTALAAAAGKPVFNLFNVKRKLKIFFIDEENGQDEIYKRVKLLKKGLNISEDEVLDISYLSFFNAKLDVESKQKKVTEFIEKFKPDLIIVDCLQRVLSIDIDKENQLLSHFFTTFIRPSIQKYNCSWLFVHHYRKRDKAAKYVNPLDEIRGASELRNYIRFAWGLHRQGKAVEGEEDILLLKQLKLSNAPPSSDRVIGVTTTDDSLIMDFKGLAEDVLNTEQLAAKAITEWIIEQDIKQEFKTKDVTEAEPGGYKKTTLQAALKLLVGNGFLTKLKQGVYVLATANKQKSLEDSDEPKN